MGSAEFDSARPEEPPRPDRRWSSSCGEASSHTGRAEPLLEKATGASAGNLVERVFAGVDEFADGGAQYDDITVVAVRYLDSFSQPTRT